MAAGDEGVHGGPDAQGGAAHDFSTNANACGPCPAVLDAVRRADATRYPDPSYAALCARLAAFHGVAPARIVVAGSASECIVRLTAAVSGRGNGRVVLPAHAYGDYARAARAQGFTPVAASAIDPADTLAWSCDPSSPLGQAEPGLADRIARLPPGVPLVLDRAYTPLRLNGGVDLEPAMLARVWQLWSPNKALGLTGVRGAYAIAPVDDPHGLAPRLRRLAPSWPLGAHAVAMLDAWPGAAAQAWLAQSLLQLGRWKTRQLALCQELGWQPLASDTNYFCARIDGDAAGTSGTALQRLRARGVQLRDCASFGLAGHVRLAVLPPASQDALARAWRSAG